MSSIRCPECGTSFDATGLAGRSLVHCPTCGRGIERSGAAWDDAAAALGPRRTSGLAVLAFVCGLASLVAPVCLCPAAGFLLLSTVPVAAPPAPVAVTPMPATPGTPMTVTFPDGTTTVIDPATGQPVPPPPPPPPADDGEDR